MRKYLTFLILSSILISACDGGLRGQSEEPQVQVVTASPTPRPTDTPARTTEPTAVADPTATARPATVNPTNTVQATVQSTDVCKNLDGIQSTPPAGLMVDASGNCVSAPVSAAKSDTPVATAGANQTSTATPKPVAVTTPGTSTQVQVTGAGSLETFTPRAIQTDVGYWRQYEPSGVGNTISRTIQDLPAGKTLVVGGYKVRFGSQVREGGWYVFVNGPLQNVSFVITDGFYSIVDETWGERETCKRLADARLAGWAMRYLPWADWESRCKKYE